MHPAPDAAILRRGHVRLFFIFYVRKRKKTVLSIVFTLQLAHVMAAAAFLDSSSTSETAGVALAAQNLESARSLAAALADVVTAVDAQDSKAQIYSHILVIFYLIMFVIMFSSRIVYSNFFLFFLSFIQKKEFQVAVRRWDSDAAMAAVEATKLLQAATAEHFIKMAEIVGGAVFSLISVGVHCYENYILYLFFYRRWLQMIRPTNAWKHAKQHWQQHSHASPPSLK